MHNSKEDKAAQEVLQGAKQTKTNQVVTGVLGSTGTNRGDSLTMTVPEPNIDQLHPMVGHQKPVLKLWSTTISNPSPREVIISIDDFGGIGLWDLSNDKAYKLKDDDSNRITAVAFTEDQFITALIRDNVVSLFSLSNGTELRSRLFKTRITSAVFQPGAANVLVAGADSNIYRWRLSALAPNEALGNKGDYALERYIGHATVIGALAFHPYGRVFFSGDWNGTLSAWLTADSDMFQGRYNQNLLEGSVFSEKATRAVAARADQFSINQIVVSPDGEYLFTVLADGRVEWWLTRGFKKAAEIQAHKGIIYQIAISQDGQKLATIGRDGHSKLFSLIVTAQDGTKLITHPAITSVYPDAPSAVLVRPGEFSIVQDFDLPLPGARAVTFSRNNAMIVGTEAGLVLEVKK